MTSLAGKTVHTFGTLLFGQGASIAAGIVTAHAFGPAGKGAIAFAAVLLTFAVTTADGIKNAIAHQFGRGYEAAAVWRASLRLMAVAAPAGSLLFAVAAVVAHRPAYLYVALAFPFSMYVQAVGILYILRDRVEEINVTNALTIGGGYSLAVIAFVLVWHAPVSTILGLWVAMYVVAAIWCSRALPALLRPANDGAAVRRAQGELAREQLGFALKAALSANVTFLALRVDVFIVSALLRPEALGVYTLALATGEVLWQVSRSVIWSSSGRVALLERADSARLVAKIVRSLLVVQIAAGLVLFAAGPWLIAHVYGARFAEAGTLLRLLLPGIVLYGADGMLAYFIAVRAGRPAIVLTLESITLVICASVTLLAVPRYGLAGAAIANTVAYVLAFAVKAVVAGRLGDVGLSSLLIPRVSDVPPSIVHGLRRLLPSGAFHR